VAGDWLAQALTEQASDEPTLHPTPLSSIVESYDSPFTLPSSSTASVNLDIKPGLKLMKTKERWAESNTYFHKLFASRIAQQIVDLDEKIQGA